MLKPRVLSALCAAAGLTLSSGGAQAEVAPVRDTLFAKMCRGEATAEQVQQLRHHFNTRKTRSVLDRALWRALSQHCRPEVADMLLGAGASPNIRDRRGVTPLVFAAEEGNPEVVRRLLAAGAQVNEQARGGETALMRAAMHRRSEAVKLLLAAGADAGIKDRSGFDALQHARSQADNDEVIRLLQGGAQGQQ